MNKPRFCIIAQNSFGALCGGGNGHVGGAERQTTLLACWLAERGYPVSIVTWDEGQPQDTVLHGVRVIPMCKSNAGLPGVRFFHPRLTSLYAALRRADADVYYHNSAEYVTGLAAWWCRRHGRKFIYSAAAELACDARLPLMSKSYERWLYRYGIRRADLRIVQTRRQQQLFENGWALDAKALPMPCPGPLPDEYVEPVLPQLPRILWVGRLFEGKRLEWLLDIAERIPEASFEAAIANADSSQYARSLRERADRLPNFRWLGALSRERMLPLYQNATCLCCTSVHEGFPNTFLEAWSHGVPVVSSFDPDDVIANQQLGLVARTVPDFVQAIRSLANTPDHWWTLSRNGRNYYVTHHLVDSAMASFERTLLELCWPGGEAIQMCGDRVVRSSST